MLNVSGEGQGPFSLLVYPAFPATPSQSLLREPGYPLARPCLEYSKHSVLDPGFGRRVINIEMYLEEWNQDGGTTEVCPDGGTTEVCPMRNE